MQKRLKRDQSWLANARVESELKITIIFWTLFFEHNDHTNITVTAFLKVKKMLRDPKLGFNFEINSNFIQYHGWLQSGSTKVRTVGVRTVRAVRIFSKFLVFGLFGVRTVRPKWTVRSVRCSSGSNSRCSVCSDCSGHVDCSGCSVFGLFELFGLFVQFGKFCCSVFGGPCPEERILVPPGKDFSAHFMITAWSFRLNFYP